jgi:hypothetical protein
MLHRVVLKPALKEKVISTKERLRASMPAYGLRRPTKPGSSRQTLIAQSHARHSWIDATLSSNSYQMLGRAPSWLSLAKRTKIRGESLFVPWQGRCRMLLISIVPCVHRQTSQAVAYGLPRTKRANRRRPLKCEGRSPPRRYHKLRRHPSITPAPRIPNSFLPDDIVSLLSRVYLHHCG